MVDFCIRKHVKQPKSLFNMRRRHKSNFRQECCDKDGRIARRVCNECLCSYSRCQCDCSGNGCSRICTSRRIQIKDESCRCSWFTLGSRRSRQASGTREASGARAPRWACETCGTRETRGSRESSGSRKTRGSRETRGTCQARGARGNGARWTRQSRGSSQAGGSRQAGRSRQARGACQASGTRGPRESGTIRNQMHTTPCSLTCRCTTYLQSLSSAVCSECCKAHVIRGSIHIDHFGSAH